MSRKIVVTSGKGGVGKTTIVAGLGYTLAENGYKVMLVDMDFGLNNLDVLMGIENKIVYDIIDVLESKCSPRSALVQDMLEPNLYVFPSSHGYCRIRFGARELSAIISSLEKYFDFVLIDCPAGIDGGFRRAVDTADETIIVTTPHLSAIRDADKVIASLRYKTKPMLIVNRVRGDLILDEKMISINAIKDALDAELIGAIPEDDNVTMQLISAEKFDKNSSIQKSLNLIAENIISGGNKIFDCEKKFKGLFGGIRKKIRRNL